MATSSGSAPEPSGGPQQRQLILQQPPTMFGRFGKVLLALLLVSVMGNVSQQMAYQQYFQPDMKIQEKYFSHLEKGQPAGKVAIIRASGALLEGDGFVKRQIDAVREDSQVQAVVLRIDSPGGTVTASDYLYHHLNKLRVERDMPLVVSMGSVCASGGYYIAMSVGDQQDSIFAEQSTWTGSIGVVIPHYDLTGLLESVEIEDDSIASHPLKLLGSPTRQLPEEYAAQERAILQGLVEDSFERFKEVVRAGRPFYVQNEAALERVTTGQIFSASQAKANRLIDKIGFLEDAVDRAIEMADLSEDEVRVVEYKQPPTILDALAGGQAAWPGQPLSLEKLFELASPRAYYMSTLLPKWISSAR